MLSKEKLKLIESLVSGASPEELIWMNGYFSGLLAGTAPERAQPVPGKVTIAYGTETGNAKKLATDFAAKARKKGISAKLVSLDQYKLPDLQKEDFFITVISTQGEGDPPDGARKFYEGIHKNGFRLEKLKYGVLALGDTSYPLYCKAGEDVDAQLNKLGGERLIDLQKCDTDYEADAAQWFARVLGQLNHANTAPLPVVVPVKSGKKTYKGTLLSNINLNDRGSSKQTHHIEIAAEDVVYQPGDALGIMPENPASLVHSVLSLTGAAPDQKISFRNEDISLEQLLLKKVNITYLPERVVAKYASLVQQEIPATRMSLSDLLRIYPAKENQLAHLWPLLEPNAPRLYSISSSPEAHSGEIHLTVARDRFQVNGSEKFGLCSDFFCQLPEGAAFDFYIHSNNAFRLPSPDSDVIMIGPGTGIAPFRSFLAHRDATGATGRNWLFFGDQHFATDFLYQTELQNWAETGLLTRINTAFSRDQANKIYVQHRMLQHSEELFAWIEAGAYLYVCGAKEPMSIDVEHTLLLVLMQEGKLDTGAAQAYLEAMKEQNRYQKDVY